MFFYAKRTPLADDSRRVIVGVGRVKGVGELIEYRYAKNRPPGAISGFLWERPIHHSIRPDGKDGFLLPYQQLLALSDEDPGLDLTPFVAFAPDEAFGQFSFGSELLTQDNAIASLLSVERALRVIREKIEGPWDEHRAWVDRELNRLWKLRGAFPGFGAALSAFGIQNGNLLAWHIAGALDEAKGHDHWREFELALADPAQLPRHLRDSVGPTVHKKWVGLPKERKALLKLLSRFELSNDQAAFWWLDTPTRRKIGLEVADADVLGNPYLIFERGGPVPVGFSTIDRGLFVSPHLREKAPIPEPSRVTEVIDPRRVRALMVEQLETAAGEGHTLLPEGWLIERVRGLAISPPCPLDADAMPIFDGALRPEVELIVGKDKSRNYQLARYVDTRRCIADIVRKRRQAAPHPGEHKWAALVDAAIGDKTPKKDWDESEPLARAEKTAALKMIYQSRISVLLGAAGTGKSTLIKALCAIPGIVEGGVLLLAPTGKARVRLEHASGMKGHGQTIAQFLFRYERYDGETGSYFMNPLAARSAGSKTVVIDECSMLTEDQLAATLDALQGVERFVLVGDPKQLPPIGAGRPFVDIVKALRPVDAERKLPCVAQGYAELQITRRQKASEERIDLEFANMFGGGPLQPGLDEVWSKVRGNRSKHIEVIRWTSPNDLEQQLVKCVARTLKLESDSDELGFELSYGGTEYGGRAYFWPGKNGEPGAANKAEAWQLLSPLRGSQVGTDALNRLLQGRFRASALKWSAEGGFARRIPRPMGPHRLLWGDKVINVQNSGRRKTWPELDKTYSPTAISASLRGSTRPKEESPCSSSLKSRWHRSPVSSSSTSRGSSKRTRHLPSS